MNSNWEIRYQCIKSDEDGCLTDWRDFETEKEAIEFINGEVSSKCEKNEQKKDYLESFFPGVMEELEGLSL